jgi:RNA polymerase sigma factor (sigma-70 family)
MPIMAEISLTTLVQRLRHLAADRREGHADADLLRQYLEARDPLAFEVLVWRHAPVVLGVCRRLLHHDQDTEDVFQATFLALARQARSIHRGQSVCGWLYTVACRLANKVRIRRRDSFLESPAEVPARPAEDADTRELRQVLDEEVNRLPRPYRQAFLLCCLQGLSNTEAARELGCAKGTIDSRLAWARRRLRVRLTRRGIGLAALAAVGSQADPLLRAASPPGELVRETVGLLERLRPGAQAVSLGKPTVETLLGETVAMTSRKWLVAALLIPLALAMAGVGWAMSGGESPRRTGPAAEAPEVVQPQARQAAPAHPGPEPKPPVPTQRFSVAGSIQAPDGKPVRNAKVYFISEGILKRQDCADGNFSFKDEAIPVHDDPTKKAPTGWFRLVATAPEHGFIWGPAYRLIARPPQRWEMRIGDEVYVGEEPGKSFSLQFHEAVPCAGRITDEAGQPLADTVIRIQNCEFLAQKDNPDIFRVIGDPFIPNRRDDPSITTKTDRDGRFRLLLPRESKTVIRIEHPEYAPLVGFVDNSGGGKAEAPPAKSTTPQSPTWVPPLALKLVKPRTVRVHVRDDVTGQPLPGTKLFAYLPPLTSSRMAEGVADRNGDMVFRLPPGRFWLWGVAREGTPRHFPTGGDLVVKDDARQQHTFVMKRGRVVKIEVVDADTGKGISGISFRQTFAKDRFNAFALGQSSAAGKLEALASVGRGEFKVEAAAVESGYTEVEVPTGWLKAELGEPLTLRFRLRPSDRKHLPNQR